MLKALEFIQAEASKCLECASCREVCDIAAAVAQKVPPRIALDVALGASDERERWFVPRCSLCGRCSFVCPQGIDTPALMVAARSVMTDEGTLDVGKYRPMLVDERWHAISLYRDAYGLDFSAYRKERAPIAFLPGCTLLNAAPDAALKTLEWLEEAFECEVSLVDRCCGMPLQEMGLLDRYEAYLDDLFGELKEMGARKLIAACPNCLGRLAQHGSRAGITTQIVYEPMAAMGFRAPLAKDMTICVHDSCPARGTLIGSWVRAIVGAATLVEAQHHGDCSQCCGSGGAVGMYDSVLSGIRAQRRRDELVATGADAIVTYCMSSCSTLFDADACPNVRHVLELAFSAPADHGQYAELVEAMWQGESGERCDALLNGENAAR